MSLRRYLGLEPKDEGPASALQEGPALAPLEEQLDRLDPAEARYLACFASVLARVAQADLHIHETESAEMRRRIGDLAEMEPEEAALVVEIAEIESRALGPSEKKWITQAFRSLATPEQRTELVFCLYAVAAADGSISEVESAEILAIAAELGVTRREVSRVRARGGFGALGG